MPEINKSSIKFIFGCIYAGVTIFGFTLIALMLPTQIDYKLGAFFNEELIPEIRNGGELLTSKTRNLLSQKKQESITQAKESFSREKQAIVKGSAATLMPIVESLDMDALDITVSDIMATTPALKGLRIKMEEDGEFTDFGSLTENGVKTYQAVQRTEYSFVELIMFFDTSSLVTSIGNEEKSFNNLLGNLNSSVADIILNIEKSATTAQESISNDTRNAIIFAAILASLVFTLVSVLLVNYLIVSRLVVAKDVLNAIADGDLGKEICDIKDDEIGQLFQTMKIMQIKLTRVIEGDIQGLVDSAGEGDLSGRIDLNDKQGFFKKLCASINELVNVNEQLVNDTARIFRAMSSGDLSQTIQTEYGGSFNELKQNANLSVKQLTQVIEGDIHRVVNAALTGDLSERINLDDKDGFFKRLSQSINELVDVNEQVVNDTLRVFGAMAKGDLTQTIDRQYHGAFNQLKQDANKTISELTQAIEGDVQNLVNAASKGDLSQRITLGSKQGFFVTLSQGVNELVDVSERILNDTARVMSALAKGDLTKTIETHYDGQFGKLKGDANSTVKTLTKTINEIRQAASTAEVCAEKVSSGNKNLSSRIDAQAFSLKDTALSMQRIAISVNENADNAGEANQLAAIAHSVAIKGGEKIEDTTGAMKAIKDSSSKIGDIISIINEIAFQTNLLALNAAVEAARAGEHGRGFSVVASEVRNLSQRSAGAAKEIKDLIDDSVSKIDQGMLLVSGSGDTLIDIVGAVDKVVKTVENMASSSREQAAGISDVNSAISELDKITQQNSALVGEANAGNKAMLEQSITMRSLISLFKVPNL